MARISAASPAPPPSSSTAGVTTAPTTSPPCRRPSMPPVLARHWRRPHRIEGPVLELAFPPAAAFAVAAGLAVELRPFAPGRAPGKREAVVWSAGWLLLALAVAAGIALAGGPSG